jgi:cell division transport system permease protein
MRARKAQWSLRVTTFIVVSACFVVMGFSLLLSQNFQRILTLWGEDVQMTVYLSSDLSEPGRLDIEKLLQDTGKVGKVTLITQEKALSDFRTQLAAYAPDLSQDDELLKVIPASLQVSLASDIAVEDQTTTLQSLAAVLKDKEGIDEVSYGQEWVAKYASIVNAVHVTLNSLGVIILLASLFVMSNAIRASIQTRFDEIVVLEMVGATATTIRKPFMQEGALLGFLSSSMALGLCFVLFYGFKNLLVNKLSFFQLGQHLGFLPIWVSVVFILLGTFLGAFGSYLCVRKLNTGWAAAAQA